MNVWTYMLGSDRDFTRHSLSFDYRDFGLFRIVNFTAFIRFPWPHQLKQFNKSKKVAFADRLIAVAYIS